MHINKPCFFITGILYLAINSLFAQEKSFFKYVDHGFYPVDPVPDNYQLGTPLFKQAVITLDNGKKFVITQQKALHQLFISNPLH